MEQIAREVDVSVATIRYDLTLLGDAVELMAGTWPYRYRRRQRAVG